MARMQDFLRRIDDRLRRDRGDNDLHLDLRDELRRDLRAAVHLAVTFLQAVARDRRHRHARDADALERILERLEALARRDDRDAGDGLAARRHRLRDRHRLRRLRAVDRRRRRRRAGHLGHRHEVRIGGREAVLLEVEAGDLLLRRDAQADRGLEDAEYDRDDDRDIDGDGDNAEHLHEEEMRLARVEQAVLHSEEAREDRAERAADAVDSDRADRIIDFELLVDELDGKDDDDTGDEADEERAYGAHGIAARGNRDEACERAVERHRDIRMAVAQPREHHDRDRRRRGREVRRDENRRSRDERLIAGHRDRRAAVEPEPCKPEDEHAERRERQAVARDGVDGAVLVVLADARAEHVGADERADAADHVDSRGTGEIMEAHLAEPAAAPDPMTRDRVDDHADEDAVNAVSGELRALCHRAGDDCRRRRAEHRLENHIRHRRIARVVRDLPVLYEEIRRADDAADVIAEHQAKADDPEDHRAEREVHDILHDDVAGVLRPREARLDHRETRLHEEDERRAEEHPDGIYRHEAPGVSRLRGQSMRRSRREPEAQRRRTGDFASA